MKVKNWCGSVIEIENPYIDLQHDQNKRLFSRILADTAGITKQERGKGKVMVDYDYDNDLILEELRAIRSMTEKEIFDCKEFQRKRNRA